MNETVYMWDCDRVEMSNGVVIKNIEGTTTGIGKNGESYTTYVIGIKKPHQINHPKTALKEELKVNLMEEIYDLENNDVVIEWRRKPTITEDLNLIELTCRYSIYKEFNND